MSERPTNPGAATSIGEITRLIAESSGGSDAARDRLTSILYAELHGMARSRMRGERPDHTLGATGLVNETYLRLFRSTGADHGDAGLPWRDRRAFFAAAATAMRRILIDHARAKKSDKRGGKRLKEGARIEADAVAAAESLDPSDYIALDEAIDRLEQIDERAAQVTRLRFFAGQDVESVAEITGVSSRTVKRDWEFARAYLHDALARGGED